MARAQQTDLIARFDAGLAPTPSAAAPAQRKVISIAEL